MNEWREGLKAVVGARCGAGLRAAGGCRALLSKFLFRFPPSFSTFNSSIHHHHHFILLPLSTTTPIRDSPLPSRVAELLHPSCGVARPRILALYAVHRNQLHPIIHHSPSQQTLIHPSSLAPAFNP